jgi:hypothetical protein
MMTPLFISSKSLFWDSARSALLTFLFGVKISGPHSVPDRHEFEMLRVLRAAAPLRRAAALATATAAGATYFCLPAQAEAPAPGLDPSSWVPLKLVKSTPLTKDSAIYRFAFADPEATSGMTVASCLLVKAAIGSEKADGTRANVMRPYTPMSGPDAKGHMDLMIKVYPTGKMGNHISSLKIGDTLDFKGPILKRAYKPNQYDSIGMVAGANPCPNPDPRPLALTLALTLTPTLALPPTRRHRYHADAAGGG